MFKIICYIIILYCAPYSDCLNDILDCVDEEGFICQGEMSKELYCSQICDGFQDCKDGSDEGMQNKAWNPCINVDCSSSSFKCYYGACIPIENLCDGEKNCADGSDEWSFFCNPKLRNPNRTACGSQERYPNYILDEYFCDGKADCKHMSDEAESMCKHWRCDTTKTLCAYGACIDKGKLCDGTADCVDNSDEEQCPGTKPPSDPPFGCEINWDSNYAIMVENNNAYMERGERVEINKRIIINCVKGFFFADKLKNKLRQCNGVDWDSPLPKCVKYCDADILYLSNSTTVKCSLYSSPVDCKNILPDTVAEIRCENSYQKWDNIRDEYYSMKCLDNGKWSRDKMNCVPVCGETLSSTNPEASGAPWHVGVKTYLNEKCGGTILSVRNVLTALHCVQDEDEVVLNATQVFVIAGGEFKDGQTQIITKYVSKIYAHDNSAIDVAVLELSEPFVLSMNARPICMPKRDNISTKRRAFVHGWPTDDDHIGDIFRKTKLIKFNTDNCHANYTKDEFCVRPMYLNHTLCQGHSGSGVIVEDGYKNYLIGIISYNPARSFECTNHPIVAISIAHIQNWLSNTISISKEPSSYRVPM